MTSAIFTAISTGGASSVGQGPSTLQPSGQTVLQRAALQGASPSMSTRHQVFITDFISNDLSIEREILGDIADVVGLNAKHESELLGKIDQADAVMMYHAIQMTSQVIERLKRCKLIVRCGVGVDNVDRVAARKHGIPVSNVPDYGTDEVADSAIGLLLSLTRGIHLLNSRLRRGSGSWSYLQAAPVHRLQGRTLGIVGLGRIGTAAALRGKALGMRVLFYDPYLPDGYDKAIGVERVESLSELLSRSFALTLHCPLTPETTNLIDEAAIAQMPRGSFLVNTSRGGVVEPKAVVNGLADGHLAGAGIDVLVQEPPDDDHPLLVAWRDPQHPAHDRLLLNPHSAFYSEEGLLDMRVKGSQSCRRALLGETLRNVVN